MNSTYSSYINDNLIIMAFCYWQIRNNIDLIVGSALSLCSFLLTAFALYNLANYLKIRREIQVQSSLRIIYIYMPLWGLSHLTKLVFGLIVYSAVFRNNQLSPDFQDRVEIYSQIFCVMDSISTVFLHGLLLLVPYIWLFNILGYVVHVQEKQIKISKYMLMARSIKFYMFFRYIIYIGLFLSQLIIPSESQTLCSIINEVIILESFLCMVLFLLCLFILLENLQYLRFNDEREKAQLLREFIMIAFFCLIRFVINFFFIILSDQECDFTNYRKQELRHTAIYLGFGIITTHFVPIILLYNIFKLKMNENKGQTSFTEEDIKKSNIYDSLLSK